MASEQVAAAAQPGDGVADAARPAACEPDAASRPGTTHGTGDVSRPGTARTADATSRPGTAHTTDAASRPGTAHAQSDAAEDTPARTDEADAAAASSSAAARAAEPGDSTPAKRQPEGEPEKEPPAVRSRPSTSQSTGNAAQADKGEAAEEEVAVEKPRVQVYGSTVSGNRTYKKQAKELFTMLEACEVDFEFICIAADEGAKRYIRRKALGNMTIPQIYVDGELRGFFDDAFKANECDELYEWLGLDEDPVE